MSGYQIPELPGQVHFVTFSTFQKRRFLSPDRARSIVTESLQTCLQTHRAHCHGFVVMPDHVHLLLSFASESKLSSFIQPWKKTSSYRIKQFYRQRIPAYLSLCQDDCAIWQAGYHDYLVDTDEKLTSKIEYIHNNPIVAGLVRTQLDWPWSSARHYEKGEWVGVTITPSR